MRDLLKTGRILGRNEMKKIMAGSGGGGCMDTCQQIAYVCYGAALGHGNATTSVCDRQFQCCAGMCMNFGC